LSGSLHSNLGLRLPRNSQRRRKASPHGVPWW
jgi:hypothetical protein